MQTITLSSIMQKWADILATNTTIRDFCLETYGKEPMIYIGFNQKKPPTLKDCPVIILFPGNKDEGLEQDTFTYRASVGWSIVNETVDTSTPGIVKYPGVFESDHLGQLIWGALAEASSDNPVSRVFYDLEAVEFFPQIPGRMDLEIDITPPIGATIEY